MKLFNQLIVGAFTLILLSACSAKSSQQTMNNSQEISEENTAEKVTELSPREKLIAELPEDSAADDWELLLVNEDNPVPENYEVSVNFVPAYNGMLMDERIYQSWMDWYHDALEAGHELVLVSAYRSVDHQISNIEYFTQQRIDAGMSFDEARAETMRFMAVPGASEHHTGLALDIVDTDWYAQHPEGPLRQDYDTHPSQHYLIDSMADFGFILRYPKGKEEITGIGYESWHFRYVGPENAKFMQKHELTLEEYVGLIAERDQQE